PDKVRKSYLARVQPFRGSALDKHPAFARIHLAYWRRGRISGGQVYSSSPYSAAVWRVSECWLATLDDAAFGAASSVTPRFVPLSDPPAQWTGTPAFFAYANLSDRRETRVVARGPLRVLRQQLHAQWLCQ